MSGICVVHVFKIRQILLRDTLALIICKSTGGPKQACLFYAYRFLLDLMEDRTCLCCDMVKNS